jgi:VWFA-related protein
MRLWLAGLAVVSLTLVVSAQQPVFRTGTELVQVDVVVTDKDGQPVHGLKATDFMLLDRKKPRTVSVFNEVNYDHDPDAPVFPPTLRLDVADNSTTRATRLVVVILDDLALGRQLDQAKPVVKRILTDLGPNASMALVLTGGDGGIEVTDDRALLFGRIDRLKPVIRDAGPPTAKMEYLSTTMRDVARMLGVEADRRKAVILLSPGFTYDVNGLFDSMRFREESMLGTRGGGAGLRGSGKYDDDWLLLEMVNSMRKANVTTYAINPIGSDWLDRERPGDDAIRDPAGVSSDASTMFGTDGSFGWNRPSNIQAAFLSGIAKASGGFAITDPKAMAAGLARLESDLDHYYMLGFYPDDPDKGWRNLEVTVNRPDVTVRFRPGYELGAVTPPPKNKNEMIKFSATVLPKTELPLKMFVTPLAASGKETRMAITLQIRADRALLMDADGVMRDTLKIQTVAVDLSKKKIVKAIERDRWVELHARLVRGVAPDVINYQIVSEWDLPPGSYQLRTSAKSTRLSKAGSVYLMVDVPNYSKTTVELSGLVIGYADTTRHTSATSVEKSLLPLEPVLDRGFQAADTLRVFYNVWRKSPDQPAKTRIDIVDAQDKVIRSIDRDVPPRTDGHVDEPMPLAGLVPGAYRLRVSVADAKNAAQREVGFVIR